MKLYCVDCNKEAIRVYCGMSLCESCYRWAKLAVRERLHLDRHTREVEKIFMVIQELKTKEG